MDRAILAAALAFIVLLGGLTVAVVIEHGPDILTVGSLLVLAMFAFGIVGALRHPPE
jgi:hypothetical protein